MTTRLEFQHTPPPSVHNDQRNLPLLASAASQLPTPPTTSEDKMTSSSDDEWMYPPPSVPLPLFELPRLILRAPPVPEDLPPLDIPLQQFEDLQVETGGEGGELVKSKDGQGIVTSELPGDVDMQRELPDGTHPPPIATVLQPTAIEFDNSGQQPIDDSAPEFSLPNDDPLPSHYTEDSPDDTHDMAIDKPSTTRTSVPPIEAIATTPSTDDDEYRPDDPLTHQNNEKPEQTRPQGGSIAAYDFDNDNWRYSTTPPRRTFYQAHSFAAMVRTIRQLLALLLPLNALRFGQRQTHRPINRLSETIPRAQFHQLFREYQHYKDLAESICSVREDQQKIPNRWLPYLQRVRRVRQLLRQYIDNTESLLKNHGYLDGLKEYAAENKVEFWLAESPGGLLYTHELQYLFGLNCFLIDNDYPHLAQRTQRIYQGTFDHAGDLWQMVYAILNRLDPPSYEFELDCNFEPRTVSS